MSIANQAAAGIEQAVDPAALGHVRAKYRTGEFTLTHAVNYLRQHGLPGTFDRYDIAAYLQHEIAKAAPKRRRAKAQDTTEGERDAPAA